MYKPMLEDLRTEEDFEIAMQHIGHMMEIPMECISEEGYLYLEWLCIAVEDYLEDSGLGD